MSDPVIDSTNDPTGAGDNSPGSNPAAAPVAAAENIIDELRAEIRAIRQDSSKTKSQADAIIGELTAKIEKQEDYIGQIRKQFEKFKDRPQQTLVPPPPPPPDAASTPAPPNQAPDTRPRGFKGWKGW